MIPYPISTLTSMRLLGMAFALVVTIGTVPIRAQVTNVGIGTASPNSSAILDLTSTSQGLLIPRMTQSQRGSITGVATADLVYCTDSLTTFTPSTYYYYNGSAWKPLIGNYIANYLTSDGVIYGPTSQQATLAAGATPQFNVAYAAASGATVTNAGAEIESNASGATSGSATGLTMLAIGSGSGTKVNTLLVSATGAAADTAIDATNLIAANQKNIGTTSTDGVTLQNMTASTSGTKQQYSSRIDLVGTAYNSSSSTSQTDKFIVENQPQTVAGTTTANLVFSDVINGGTASQDAVLSNGGNLLLGQAGNTTGSLSLATSGAPYLTTIESSSTSPTSAYTYVLPAQTSVPVAGQVLSISSVTGTGPYTVNLQWGTSATTYTHVTSAVDSVDAITSTTGKMGGIGVTFTPNVSGHMLLILSGDLYTSSDGASSSVQLYYGTGTTPLHNANPTGTPVAGLGTVQPLGAPHIEVAPFMIETYQSLTPGTTYWIDGAVSASSGSATLGQVVATVVELP